ncbi:unnamed protein product [Moneuplotes crassus]|uniref:N-acetyltransferase domain-containing protein n=1 Tax=Euplotes crassus TaxID=5936 RepID=A0AAD1UN33_EUPCR|nr:unnamed protein product [Moneuplotes crassus]
MLEDEFQSSNKLPADFLTKIRKKKAKGVESVVLIPFTDEYFEELIDGLLNDDDPDSVKEFLYGSKGQSINKSKIRSMLYKYSTSNHIYKPFRICIKTVYNSLIPIGTAHLTAAKGANKINLRKFYIEKMWRKKGYEQKSLLSIGEYCFNKLYFEKIYYSTFSINQQMIQCCKEAGFKFNKTTAAQKDDPTKRHILYLYKEDYDTYITLGSTMKDGTKASSTMKSKNLGSSSKMSPKGSPCDSSCYISPIKCSSPKRNAVQLPQIAFHKSPRLDSRGSKLPVTLSSMNASQYTSLPKIVSPNYYHRSNRYKNNSLMDSVVAMDAEILKERKSLENLRLQLRENSISLGMSPQASRMRNSSSQCDIYDNKINLSIAPNEMFDTMERSPANSDMKIVKNPLNIKNMLRRSSQL